MVMRLRMEGDFRSTVMNSENIEVDDDDENDDDYDVDDDHDDHYDDDKDGSIRSRAKTITFRNDVQIESILNLMGFYKFLRRKICKKEYYTRKHALQIVKKSSCFLAFIHNRSGGILCVRLITRMIRSVVSPEGQKIVHIYCEQLGKTCRPTTLTHNIDYIKSLVEWALCEIRALYNTSSNTFNLYCNSLRTKVCDILSYKYVY